MLVLALNPGHDGAIAAVQDRQLLFSFESEKDSFLRHSVLTPTSMLQAMAQVDSVPDIFALSGWLKPRGTHVGAGYLGVDPPVQEAERMFGKQATFFTSSHERSHIMMAIGMAPRHEPSLRAVLVWEGAIGNFYLVNERCEIERRIPVLSSPGSRFAFLFALADPLFPDMVHRPGSRTAAS